MDYIAIGLEEIYIVEIITTCLLIKWEEEEAKLVVDLLIINMINLTNNTKDKVEIFYIKLNNFYLYNVDMHFTRK